MAFSRKLNRLVYIAAESPWAWIENPETGEQERVALLSPGRSVTVSVDGLQSLVTHEFSVTRIDLTHKAPPLAVPVVRSGSSALAGSWIYTSWPNGSDILGAFDLRSRRGRDDGLSMPGSVIKPHPSGKKLYLLSGTPRDVRRVDINDGAMVDSSQALYHKALWKKYLEMCGGLWISDRGGFAANGCGGVFTLSDTPGHDLEPLDTIPNLADERISALDLSEVARRLVLAPASRGAPADILLTYELPGLKPIARDVLPRLVTHQGAVVASARFIFISSDGKRQYVVLSAPGQDDSLYSGPIK